jgi:Tfp pilus assembly protein PilO
MLSLSQTQIMSPRDRQITKLITQFYDKPIAKVSLELFFSIVAVILFALFAIRPTLITMSDLIKEIDDKRALSVKLTQKIASLNSVQPQYTTAQDQIAILDEAIPSAPQFEQALTIIEKLASDRQLVIRSLEVKDVPKETTDPNASADSAAPAPTSTDSGKMTRISRPISVTVMGTYPAVRQFVQDILNTRRAMIISSIVFNVADEKGVKRLLATITIDMQYFGEESK